MAILIFFLVSLISNDERTSTCGNIPFFSERPFWKEHHKPIHLKIRNAYPERPNIPNSIAACVWLSSPVTMLPTARSAGVCTKGEVCSLSDQNLRIETSLPTVTTKKENWAGNFHKFQTNLLIFAKKRVVSSRNISQNNAISDIKNF